MEKCQISRSREAKHLPPLPTPMCTETVSRHRLAIFFSPLLQKAALSNGYSIRCWLYSIKSSKFAVRFAESARIQIFTYLYSRNSSRHRWRVWTNQQTFDTKRFYLNKVAGVTARSVTWNWFPIKNLLTDENSSRMWRPLLGCVMCCYLIVLFQHSGNALCHFRRPGNQQEPESAVNLASQR